MRFTPITEPSRKGMLEAVGIKSVADLFSDIPKKLLVEGQLGLPAEMNERQLRKELESMAAKNSNANQLSLFLGGGSYNHFIPATVPAIVGRSEFYTAYTPYQAEASQGLLQSIYEWQSHICMLTGMDVANASMYDGSTATAEAMIMARKATGREKVLVEKSLNPEYKAVLKTYARAIGAKLIEVEAKELEKELDKETACFIVQRPDFFGRVVSMEKAEKAVHANNSLFIVVVAEALSLAFLPKIAEQKADIVAAEVQSFGIPMSFGGPGAGVIACRQRFLRELPGRLVGKTLDKEGKPGFVLTLQAREQHIRRERAGSNICTNHALCALASTVYLASVGEKGLKEIAGENHKKAEYLAEKLEQLGFELPFGKDFFNEFVAKKAGARQLQEKLLGKGIVFGYLLEEHFPEMQDCLLVTATEMNSEEEIDRLATEVGEML